MTLEQQVTSLELSQRMEKLGFKQESYFKWHRPRFKNEAYVGKIDDMDELNTSDSYSDQWNTYSAFTVAELGSICKEKLVVTYENGKWWWQEPTYRASNSAETQADAYALGAIYLAENGLIDPKNI